VIVKNRFRSEIVSASPPVSAVAAVVAAPPVATGAAWTEAPFALVPGTVWVWVTSKAHADRITPSKAMPQGSIQTTLRDILRHRRPFWGYWQGSFHFSGGEP
jgi:hypothetical protein